MAQSIKFAIALMFFVVADFALLYNSKVIQNEHEVLEREVQVLATDLELTLSRLRLTSNELAYALGKRGKDFSAQEVVDMLTAASDESNAVAAVIFFDKTGQQQATSVKDAPPGIRVEDREYFKEAAAGQQSTWFGPYMGRNTGLKTYSFVNAVRINGEFGGVLVSSMGVDHLNQICARTMLGTDTALVVRAGAKIVAGCGIDTEVLSGLESKPNVVPNFDLSDLKAGRFDIDGVSYYVKPVRESGGLSIVAFTAQRSIRFDLYSKTALDSILFALALGLFILLDRKTLVI